MGNLRSRSLFLLTGVILFGMSYGAAGANSAYGGAKNLEGTFTVKVEGATAKTDPDTGISYESQIKRSGIYTVGLTQTPGHAWFATGNLAYRFDDETVESYDGSRTRHTIRASQTIALDNGGGRQVMFLLNPDGSTYSVRFPQMPVVVSSTLYETDAPSLVVQCDDQRQEALPGCEIKDLPLPTAGGQISGTRPVPILINPAVGPGVEMNVQFSWSLSAGAGLKSLTK